MGHLRLVLLGLSVICIGVIATLPTPAQQEELVIFASSEGHEVGWPLGNGDSWNWSLLDIGQVNLSGSTHLIVEYQSSTGEPFGFGLQSRWPKTERTTHIITPNSTSRQMEILPIKDFTPLSGEVIGYIDKLGITWPDGCHNGCTGHASGNPNYSVRIFKVSSINEDDPEEVPIPPGDTIGATEEMMEAWKAALWACCSIWIECGDITFTEHDHHFLSVGPPPEGEGQRVRAKFGDCD
jgi:hypothetical protein